mgnify:CR=1 FL=1
MESTDTTRRRVLAGIGGSLLSLGLAGCTGSSGSGTETDPATDSDSNDGGETPGPDASSGSLDEPDYGGWLDDVSNYDETVDRRDANSVTISVGTGSNGYRFDPPAVAVSPGTTVVWEWTGKGGSHNVIAQNADFESDLTGESGHTFEQTLDSTGVVKFYCSPHKTMGMKGAVAVVE